jgi:hypothetical protein
MPDKVAADALRAQDRTLHGGSVVRFTDDMRVVLTPVTKTRPKT